MSDDPNWPRASAWLAGERTLDPVATLTVVDAGVALGSISGGAFHKAPRAIRAVLERSTTWDGTLDVRSVAVDDRGDLELSDYAPEEAESTIADAVDSAVRADRTSAVRAITLLGGDNSITRGAVLGLARTRLDRADPTNGDSLAQSELGDDEWFGADSTPEEDESRRPEATALPRVGLVTLDAHHDLRDTDGGLTNGNPVRALLEDGLPGSNIHQIGIQPFANSPAYAEVARDAAINVAPVDNVRLRGIEVVMTEALDDLAERCDVIYVDLDIDVLDRAFAPGCPGSRPGGLMPWELHQAASLAGKHPKVAAVDIVEVDPERDIADVTIMNAARCLLSFAAGLATREHLNDIAGLPR